jgi:hypothetical protein
MQKPVFKTIISMHLGLAKTYITEYNHRKTTGGYHNE